MTLSMPARSPSRASTLSFSLAAEEYAGSVITLRIEVFRSTPFALVLPMCLSGSPVAAPLISPLALLVLPRYSVSCKLVEYSFRRGRLRKFFHENSEGSLSFCACWALRALADGARYLMVRKYVTMSIVKMPPAAIPTTTKVLAWLESSRFPKASSVAWWAGKNIVLIRPCTGLVQMSKRPNGQTVSASTKKCERSFVFAMRSLVPSSVDRPGFGRSASLALLCATKRCRTVASKQPGKRREARFCG